MARWLVMCSVAHTRERTGLVRGARLVADVGKRFGYVRVGEREVGDLERLEAREVGKEAARQLAGEVVAPEIERL